ncbi:hypothetical protein ACFLVH_06155 [Chloroflexota bacterium]
MKQRNVDLTKSLLAIKNVANNDSWFRDDPHRWATASLPLTYAVACVEVVSKSSEKARAVYNQLVEAWGHPGLKTVYEAVISEISDSELEKVKNALLHPEAAFLPDPNKPFKQLEEVFTGLEIDEDFFTDDDTEELSPEEQQDYEKLVKLVSLILEFIIVGFNRESDIEKGRYRVIPTNEAPWLIWAVMIRTSFESHNITLERLCRIYLVRKYKGKTIDFHKVLTEEPMSRWHRRMVAGGKAAKLQLKNDRVIIEAARHWYKCRVVYPSINKYCYDPSNDLLMLDSKNVEKQIRPCDEAVGYVRRLPKSK